MLAFRLVSNGRGESSTDRSEPGGEHLNIGFSPGSASTSSGESYFGLEKLALELAEFVKGGIRRRDDRLRGVQREFCRSWHDILSRRVRQILVALFTRTRGAACLRSSNPELAALAVARLYRECGRLYAC